MPESIRVVMVSSAERLGGKQANKTSLDQSQTFWNVKSSGPWKASLPTKLVEVIQFQLNYFKS